MTPEFPRRTRAGYDAAATDDARHFHHHLDGKPFERAMLGAFAWYPSIHIPDEAFLVVRKT